MHALELPPRSRAQARGDRLILVLIVLGVLAVYLPLERGKLFGYDGEAMASVARNIWLHRSVKECCRAYGAFPGDPGPWAPFGIGYSVALAPLMYFQTVMRPPGGVELGLANPVFLALATGVIAKTGLVLGWRRSTAVLMALAFALLTMAPEYSVEFLSEAGLTFALTLFLLGIALWHRRPTLGAAVTGVGGMLAVLFRADSLLLVLPTAIAVFATHEWRAVLASWRRWLFAISIPVGLAIAWTLYYDWLRYGKPFTFGYTGFYGRFGFDTPIMRGLGLQVWSPGKSLFVYAPILLAALPGLYWLARRSPPIVVAVVLLFVAHVVFYARWWTPVGGEFAWGPRFLMPMCGVLALPLGATIERVLDLRAGARRAALAVLGALAAISALVQFASVAIGRSNIVPSIFDAGAAPKALQRALYERRIHSYEWTLSGNHIAWNLRHIGSDHWATLYWWRDGPKMFGVLMFGGAVLACTAAFGAAILSDRVTARDTEARRAR